MISINNKILVEINEELNQLSQKSKVEIFNDAISDKLKASLLYYNNDIKTITSYLSGATGFVKDVRVLKAVAKKAKNNDKEIIKQYMEIKENNEK